MKFSELQIGEFSYAQLTSPLDVLQKRLLISKFSALGSGYELEGRFSKVVEITQTKSYYAVQRHSRSPILVPIESSYTTSY